MRFYKLYFWCTLICISCNHKERSTEIKNINTVQDTITKLSDSAYIKSLANKKFTPLEMEELKQIQKRQEDKEEMVKLLGEDYKEGNEIEILDKKLIFDSDFNAYVKLKLKNNLRLNFIAFEIFIIPKFMNLDCKGYSVKKKLVIKANSVLNFEEKINKNLVECKFEDINVTLGDCILENGKRITMGNIFHGVEAIGD